MTLERRGEFIISFGDGGLSGLSQTWHRILSMLAERHRVLHVRPHFYLRTGTPTLAERRERSGLRRISENLYEYQPPWYLPKNHRYPGMNDAVGRLGGAMIARAARSLGCQEPVLYLWHPRYARMASHFRERLVCYHVYDDFFGYEGGEPEGVRVSHDELLGRADLVFTASRALSRSVSAIRPDAVCIPNGADYTRFESAATSGAPMPADLAEVRGPRIGYLGNINDKVDYDLLIAMAEKRPDWSIVLIGPVNTGKEKAARCAGVTNIHFLGEKPYHEVAGYVAGLDVCIMPYVLKGWVLSGYPLKMHEYLAAGKPVVSADLDAVREFERVIRIADGPEQWIAQVELALASDDATEVAERRKVALANSWERRVLEIETLVAKALARKDAGAGVPVETSESRAALESTIR